MKSFCSRGACSILKGKKALSGMKCLGVCQQVAKTRNVLKSLSAREVKSCCLLGLEAQNKQKTHVSQRLNSCGATAGGP